MKALTLRTFALAALLAACSPAELDGWVPIPSERSFPAADSAPPAGQATSRTQPAERIEQATVARAAPDATAEPREQVAPPTVPAGPRFEPIAPQPTWVLPAGVESCAVIADTACQDGAVLECDLFDRNTGDWAQDVAPMTEQAFYFDRWYDRYHEMNGQSADVDFLAPMPAGTPESVWGAAETFERYDGIGDGASWTGTALWGAAARYQVTGTPADYQRMLEKLHHTMFLYDVTGAPGLLARSHWAMLPQGVPVPPGQWGKALSEFRKDDGTDGHFHFPIDVAHFDQLPDYYTEGLEVDGETVPTQARWLGDTSRDAYVRGLPGILLAFDMLGEDAVAAQLGQRVKMHLPCTLNRMRRGRIVNLQQSPAFQQLVATFFAGPMPAMSLDDQDLDLAGLDEMVFFVMDAPHPEHVDLFDESCPPGPPMYDDPLLVIDAAAPDFVARMLQLAAAEKQLSDQPIAWSMHVTARPGDLIWMLQWALTAHYLTGDEQYVAFVEDLLEQLPAEGILGLYDAYSLPKYCEPHYAPSMAYPSMYNLIARLSRADAPQLWELLAKTARDELRFGSFGKRRDAWFELLYGRMVDDELDPTRGEVVADGVAILETYGMSPGDKLVPDRSFPRDFVSSPDPAVPLEEIAPGDPEWSICEEPVTILGIPLPPAKIDGIPVRSVDPLPLDKRIGGTLLWQMDPWMVQRTYGDGATTTQWPGLGMFVPYWIGRSDGVIQEGQGLVLAWRSTGEGCAL